MRDLRTLLTWLLHEARATAGFAREREIWIALAAGLLLWTLAYQAPYTHRLDLGGNLQNGRRYDDTPFLDNFNDPEPNPIPDRATLLYRWSRADSTITFPGIGGGRWLARVRASAGSRPEPVLSQWDDGTRSYMIAANKAQRDYAIIVEADSAGDLTLHFATPPFTPDGDPRTLGLVMSRLVVEPVGGMRVPAARQLALLALVLALAYALLRRFALARRPALAVVLALAALAALLLARERMALTLLTPLLPAILAGCYGLGIVLDALMQIANWPVEQMGRRSSVAFVPAQAGVGRPSSVVALILLAVALRLGGMLHPHAIFSDDGLNANNMIGFTNGQVYFTEGLPSEAGGGQVPYLPGQYVMFAPAQLLFQTRSNDITSVRLLLKIANAVWDSLVVGVVWYVLRRCGCGSRAALLGAALYVLPPPLLKSLSIGEFANVFGQGLALPLLALLAIRARTLQQKPFALMLLALFTLALLGHLGVTISLICLLGCLGLFWLIRPETQRAFRVLLFAGMLAGALVALFYYSALGDVLISRVGSPIAVPSGVQSPSLAQKLSQQAGSADVYGIHALALALGLIGVALVPVRWRARAAMPGLGILLLAWWGGTLLSLGLLLFANQGVRWQSFLYPALCLGAGPALAELWPHGRAGRALVVGLVAFLAWYGLTFWVVQISDYLH